MYLRPYRAGDLDALHAMDVRCFAPPFRFSRAFLRKVLVASGSVVRLACERAGSTADEVLLGFCAVTLEQGAEGEMGGYLATLDVAPDRQRQGIGRLLLQACEAELVAEGIRWITLHVWSDNAAALLLYEAMGYQRVQREPQFYAANMDAWLYSKRLA